MPDDGFAFGGLLQIQRGFVDRGAAQQSGRCLQGRCVPDLLAAVAWQYERQIAALNQNYAAIQSSYAAQQAELSAQISELQDAVQRTLNLYEAGINVVRVNLDRADPPREVIDSFREVQAAQQERDRGYEPLLKTTADTIARYSTVFLGFPIWGMTALSCAETPPSFCTNTSV